jgi:1-acyl-sn-glycerol-3-phosphate acyltransferase
MRDSLAVRAVSVVLWIVGLVWLVPVMLLMMASALVLPSDRTEWLSRLYCWGQVRATGARWRAVVHPDVDPSCPYIFACNHVNLLDHVTMYNSTPHFKQGVELVSHFDIPVYGWFMKQRGTIPVHPGRGALDQLCDDVRAEVALGHSILVFPEGTRTIDGRVARFRKGFFRIARDLGIAVVPVAVTGMYDVNRKGSRLLRAGGDVTVWVDAPVDFSDLDNEGVNQRIQLVHETIAARVDTWMDSRRGAA